MKRKFRTIYYNAKSVAVGVGAFIAFAVLMAFETPLRLFEMWLDKDT